MPTFKILSVVAAVVATCLGASVAGCESSGDNGGANADANTGPCVDTLDRVRNTWGIRCPDTAAEGIEAGVPCVLPSTSFFTSSCGDLNVVGYSFFTHAQFCFYPADGGTLVAATANDDVPSFCAQTSYTVSAGSVRQVISGPGAESWSVSGQRCTMPALTYSACIPDASAD